jgi:uncharacterized membrane protein YedE/YeeE
MKKALTAYLCGTVFGLGLSISEMINPVRVIGFLDVAGAWDPTLLLVMISAVVIALPLFTLIRQYSQPFFSDQFMLPTKTRIDPRLITGAILFGIGWGMAGLCPGPAITALASLSIEITGFVIAMLLGMWLSIQWQKRIDK